MTLKVIKSFCGYAAGSIISLPAPQAAVLIEGNLAVVIEKEAHTGEHTTEAEQVTAPKTKAARTSRKPAKKQA